MERVRIRLQYEPCVVDALEMAAIKSGVSMSVLANQILTKTLILSGGNNNDSQQKTGGTTTV